MDAKQFYYLVVVPTLQSLGLYSEAAAQLVMGTVWQESRGKFLKQVGGGPALGVVQMEPATHDDIWQHYLRRKNLLSRKVLSLVSAANLNNILRPDSKELVTNLAYSVAMCRIHYFRCPAALPGADNIAGQAEYWKKYYNTEQGAGQAHEYVDHFPMEILKD